MASAATPHTEPHVGGVLRVYGPPGTGKTTLLAELVRETIAEHGPDSLILASFSNTAANEIAGRFADDNAAMRPAKGMVGTLHSHAYRSLGHSSVALDPRVLVDWNAVVGPELHITPDTRKSGGTSGDVGAMSVDPQMAQTGDELLGALDRLRAGLVDPEDWPSNIRKFEERWSAWKSDVDAVDYTDMISNAWLQARDGVPAPGRPQFVMLDEAQDSTPLEIALALAWGALAGQLILGMDDDQAINRWRGGDPTPLLALHGDDVVDRVLDRSYRVPEAVRAVAERWVRRLSNRREKVYHSRLGETGEVVTGAAYQVPETLRSAELVKRITQDVDAGRTVMVIASCNYMLEPLLANLRTVGLPFHNPYRPAEQRWNPLGAPSREDAMATSERVRRFLALNERDWTGADIQGWAGLVKLTDAGMVRSAKATIARLDPYAVIDFEEIAALFRDDEFGRESLSLAVTPDVTFLERALLKAKIEPAAYPIQIARNHGADALDVMPQVTVGTIHSVKGAAADIVYVCPEVSNAAAQKLGSVDGADETIRLFYVAMTRAYEELRVLTPASKLHVKTSQLIPADLEVIGA
jgi:superfamily I DNA/RNA helicase